MATIMEPATEPARQAGVRPNGAAWAAYLAAAIGAFAMGFIVVLSETDVWAPPTVYGPAGGVSGRTTAALLVWLVAWAVLHRRWRDREVGSARLAGLTAALIGLGILGTFPPFWNVF